MRSGFQDLLPAPVRRALVKLGGDIRIARKKRRLTIAMMVERLGIGRTTYLRVEGGDPKVATEIYAMTLFVLGFDELFTPQIDPSHDEHGLLLESENLPKRVRIKRRAESQ